MKTVCTVFFISTMGLVALNWVYNPNGEFKTHNPDVIWSLFGSILGIFSVTSGFLMAMLLMEKFTIWFVRNPLVFLIGLTVPKKR